MTGIYYDNINYHKAAIFSSAPKILYKAIKPINFYSSPNPERHLYKSAPKGE